jgi:protein-tyrosine phosphatase
MPRELIIPGRLMNKIIDRIYIGCYSGAQNLQFRNEPGITHILNCTPDTHSYGLKDFRIHQININDGNEVPFDEFWSAIQFIEMAVQSGGKVLVHCHAGISRSPGIVCGYLMRHGFSWDEALQLIRRNRPQVYPHHNIERSIKKYVGLVIDEKTTLLR